MADDTENNTNEAPEKKKSPLLTLAIVGVVMVVEAIAVGGFIMLSGVGTSSANATSIEGGELSEEEKTVEISLVDGRFQNHASSQAWVWTVEAVLQVKAKNQEDVTEELERRKAEITEGVSLIIRRSAHAHLMEPGLETLHRQITAYVNEVFGTDPDGDPLVERVIIPDCQGAAQH